MKKEKYIKDKLSNYQSPLDLDSMWANLEQDLDNDKEDRGILFYLKGILGIVTSILFTGLIIFSFYQLNNSTSQSTISENSTIESSTSKNNPALSAPTKNEIINDSDVNNSISNSTNSKVHSFSKRKNKAIDNKKKISQNSKKSNISQPQNYKSTTSNSSSSINNTKEETSILNSVHSTNKTYTEIKTAKHNQEKSSDYLSEIENIKSIQLLKSRKLAAPSLSNLKLELPTLSTQPINLDIPNNLKWRIGIHAGTTKTSHSHKNIFLTEVETLATWIDRRNGAESELFLPSFGLKLEAITKQGIKFATGLNYINHGVNFEHFQTTEGDLSDTSYTFLQSNLYPEGLLIDPQAEEAITTFSQHVCSVNKLHTLQVPMMVGFEKTKEKFDYSISLGITTSYIFGTSGYNFRIQNTNEIVDVSEAANSSFKVSTLLLGGQTELQLGYRLFDKWRIFGTAEYGRQIFNSAKNIRLEERQELKTTLSHFGFRTGLSFSF